MAQTKNTTCSPKPSADGTPLHTLSANPQSNALFPAYDLKFGWLKVPSVLLMVVGIVGVLVEKYDRFEYMSDLLDLPPLSYSLFIIAMALVLLCVALTVKTPRRGEDNDFSHDNWRSI